MTDVTLERVADWARDEYGAWTGRPGGRRLRVTVLVGGRAGRATLMLFAPGARWPALAVKIVTEDIDAAHVRREFANLRRLRGTLPPHFHNGVPRAFDVLHEGPVTALAMSAVTGTRAHVPDITRPRPARHDAENIERHAAAVRAWSRELATTETDPTLSRGTRHLVERLGRFVELASLTEEQRGRLGSFAQAVGARDVTWRPAWQHGDVAPGNILVHRGEIRLVDWEAAAADHDPWHDDAYLLLGLARNVQSSLGVPTIGAAMGVALCRSSWAGRRLQELYARDWMHPIPLGWALLATTVEHALENEGRGTTTPNWTRLVTDLLGDTDLRRRIDWLAPTWDCPPGTGH